MAVVVVVVVYTETLARVIRPTEYRLNRKAVYRTDTVCDKAIILYLSFGVIVNVVPPVSEPVSR